MTHRFVELRDGQRNVHWFKLGAAYGLLFVSAAIAVEAGWYAATGRWNYEVLVLAAIATVLLAIRSTLHAMSVPEVELGEDSSSTSQAVVR